MKRIYIYRGPVCGKLWALLLIGIVLHSPLSTLHSLRAQESAFEAKQQRMALLPGNVRNLSIVDGEVYCYASGVMLKAQRSGEQLLGFWADTDFVKLGDGVEYVVRQPQTENVYVVIRDKKARPYLYLCSGFGTGKAKLKRVKLGGGFFGNGMTVEHPTFTIDGRIMIFSSEDSRNGEGGYDLWYTQFDGERWQEPRNLGRRVNTHGDEITPVIYRDCLLYASNGHNEDHGHLCLYSTRLISDRVVGDTVGMMQIGRCRVQRLPEPLNAPDADDFDIAVDTLSGCGYWLSLRTLGDNTPQLFSFSGALDGVLLWGMVTDKGDGPLAGVTVAVRHGGETVCSTMTDEDGHYRLYLQCGQNYELAYRMDGYFVGLESVNTTKGEEEYLISESRLDVKLDRLPMGEPISYDDLFGPNTDVELSKRGVDLLAPLVQFLVDNPTVSVHISLLNDVTADRTFNALLTEERIQRLEDHLMSRVPPTVKFSFSNRCAGREGCGSATGLSRMTVLIDK